MNDPSFFLKAARQVEERGQLEQALMWIDRGLLVHPENESLQVKKASILMDGFDDVEQAFTLLLALEKSFGHQSIEELKHRLDQGLLLELYLLLTDCFRLKESFREAFNHALMANKIAPEEQASILAMATAYFELGRFKKAEELLEPLMKKPSAESLWLLAQITCAKGLIEEADEIFFLASKIDKSYHQPLRLSHDQFIEQFNLALASLPDAIACLVEKTAIQVMEIMPVDLILESGGKLCPTALISMESIDNKPWFSLYQRNIENVAGGLILDTIASVLLHGFMAHARSVIP